MIKGLYGIADAGFGDPVALGRHLVAGGACAVQLRCKGWTEAQMAAAARALLPTCRAAGVPLLVNDFAQLVGLVDGVHLGQDDGPLPKAPGKLLGRSTHSLQQVAAAAAEGAHYIGFGPVFTTGTKVGALSARGVQQLSRAVALSQVPVVAIGGIGAAQLAEVQATGAHSWACISAVLQAPDVQAAARRMGERR